MTCFLIIYDDLSPLDLAVLIKLELRTSIVLALIILDITAICGKDNAVIGRYFVVGALQRDYTLVSGVMILYASLLIILILITDILRAYLDPRVKI